MILLTGGSGKLGTELQKYIDCLAPSHFAFDITEDYKLGGEYDLIIHAAGYTNVKLAEIEKEKCYELNVQGTCNMLSAFNRIPFVYISSEYAHNPVNYYGETKLAAETAIKSVSWPYLIIRTLFKPNPYPHEYAFTDQYTMGDSVDIIAELIAKEIYKWDRQTNKLIDVGTERKTVFELAKRTKPDVKPNSVNDIGGVIIPKDYR